MLHAYRGRKKLTYHHVEEKVPELKEQLITAADNLDKEYEIVESLNKDVLQHMKKTMTSYFFSFGKRCNSQTNLSRQNRRQIYID